MEKMSLEQRPEEEKIQSELEVYESFMKTLDESLRVLENKNSNLAEVLKAYEEGVSAHQKCVEILGRMEQKVTELTIF